MMQVVCSVVLMSVFNIYLLPCVNCQLPNVYDLTWFESFSLQNYGGFLNDYDIGMGPNSDKRKIFPSCNDNLDKDPVSIGKKTNTFIKNTEESIVSADGV